MYSKQNEEISTTTMVRFFVQSCGSNQLVVVVWLTISALLYRIVMVEVPLDHVSNNVRVLIFQEDGLEYARFLE